MLINFHCKDWCLLVHVQVTCNIFVQQSAKSSIFTHFGVICTTLELGVSDVDCGASIVYFHFFSSGWPSQWSAFFLQWLAFFILVNNAIPLGQITNRLLSYLHSNFVNTCCTPAVFTCTSWPDC